MKTFGTLEYAIDKYSGSWTWKITGVRAVMMVSKLIPELWYGNGPNEVIIPDTEKNVKQIRLILELKNFLKQYQKNSFVENC